MSRPQSQWNAPLAAVMDLVLDGNVKFKHAAEVGKRAVVYCRGDELFQWVMANKDLLNRKHLNALEGKEIETEEDAIALCNRFIRFGFLYRTDYQPLDGALEQDENGKYKRPKWPKRLALSQKQTFHVQGFYCCNYEGSKRWQHFVLFCVVAFVLTVCMFPAWPLKLKIGLWYVSVVLLTFLLFLIVLRLVLYVFFWFFGYNFWLLPNLFNEDAGFIDSFIPALDVEKVPGDWATVAARVFCAILSGVSVYKLLETHSPSDIADFATQSFIDVLDWGRLKLEAPYLNSDKALPSAEDGRGIEGRSDEEDTTYEQASGDEEDYRCLASCGYTSFEDLMARKCFVKCGCLEALIDGPCFAKCPDATRAAMQEAMKDACREEERRKQRKKRS